MLVSRLSTPRIPCKIAKKVTDFKKINVKIEDYLRNVKSLKRTQIDKGNSLAETTLRLAEFEDADDLQKGSEDFQAVKRNQIDLVNGHTFTRRVGDEQSCITEGQPIFRTSKQRQIANL